MVVNIDTVGDLKQLPETEESIALRDVDVGCVRRLQTYENACVADMVNHRVGLV